MKTIFCAMAIFAIAFPAHSQTKVYDNDRVVSQLTTSPVVDNQTNEKSMSGPIGYPGNTWGTIVYGVKTPNGDTVPRQRIEGVVEQGIDWFRFGDGTLKFNTYVAGEYVVNSNDANVTPVIGMKVNKRFSDGSLDLGLRYKYGSTFITPGGSNTIGGIERASRIEVHATYWFDWNLKKN